MWIEPENEGFSIVLIGDFNPRIFNATWLEHNALVPPEESGLIDTAVVHPEITEIQTPQFNLQVQRDRFQINQLGPSDIQILEFTLKLFYNLLPHTPVRVMGINRSAHFRLGSYDDLNRLGDKLAPKSPWGIWGERLAAPSLTSPDFRHNPRRGGMRSITMEESIREDGIPGYARIVAEPSVAILPGLFMSSNEHYEPKFTGVLSAARELMSLLEAQFLPTRHRFRSIAEAVLGNIA